MSCNGQNKTQLSSSITAVSVPSPVSSTDLIKEKDSVHLSPKVLRPRGKPAPNGPFGFVKNIKQDMNGNIWFLTDEGVYRYDGTNFTSIRKEDGLSYNRTYSMLQDKSGNYWFGTVSGISAYIGRQFGVPEVLTINLDAREIMRRYFGFEYHNPKVLGRLNETAGLLTNIVSDIYEDKNGALWFGAEDGLSFYDWRTYKKFTGRDGLIDNVVTSILEEKTGKMWIGTKAGISIYDGKTFVNLSEADGIQLRNIHCMHQDSKGMIWIGSEDGVIYYDGKTFSNFSKHKQLKYKSVSCILEDKSGKIWFGFDDNDNRAGGLCSYDGKSITWFSAKEGLPAGKVLSILQDSEGNIWLGTVNGVYRYDGKTFTNFGMAGC